MRLPFYFLYGQLEVFFNVVNFLLLIRQIFTFYMVDSCRLKSREVAFFQNFQKTLEVKVSS